ncbi:MAG TPA: hypothetical protein VK636_18335 [Gemmatimonadaceae bacterium]|nr:hypothetical protein [Gemmatimonadaceae bacterium]
MKKDAAAEISIGALVTGEVVGVSIRALTADFFVAAVTLDEGAERRRAVAVISIDGVAH